MMRIPDKIRRKIIKKSKFRCAHCGKPGWFDKVRLTLREHDPIPIYGNIYDGDIRGYRYKAFHFDHIIPKSKGGTTTEDNLQILCKSCNCGKRDRFNG